jgi:hypothetical protein
MFKKYLQQPLMTLWAAIIFIRAVLDHVLLQTPDAGPWFDRFNAIFVLAIPIAEFGVFFRAYRAYSNSAVSIPASKFGISAKILLPLLFFCLPYGLWNSRRSILDIVASTPGGRWIEIAGLAAACAINLALSGTAVHSLLAAHSRGKELV